MSNIVENKESQIVTKAQDAKESLQHLEFNKIEEKIELLSSKVTRIDDKFDVWQNLVEPMLATAQSAMQYDNFIITVSGIGSAIAIGFITLWFSKSKKEAVDEAIKNIEKTIAKGILPKDSNVRSEIINTIINSEEFTDAVVKIYNFKNDSKTGDKNRKNNNAHGSSDTKLGLAKITKTNLENSIDE